MARTWRTAAAALIASVTGVGLAVVGNISPAAAAPTDLFFSEYIEGSSNNKALEIYNGTGAAVNLATGGYSIQMCFNGATTCTLTINLTGTVGAGDVYVVAQAVGQRGDPGPGRPDQRVGMVQRRRRHRAAPREHRPRRDRTGRRRPRHASGAPT